MTAFSPHTSPVVHIQPLGFPWKTIDPFLFCVYHDDAYPQANAQMGPNASLAGRDMGQDFSRRDGWSMYHGNTVPGFPAHPHRGFETVTIVRKGLIDHSDSLGAAARFGRGDVQWLTAGQGVVHSEMFPLLDQAGANPLELFQIWLNLPARSKMSAPNFTMFWSQDIPRLSVADAEGRTTDVAVIAGRFNAPDASTGEPLPPPPDSWASQADADVAIWTIRMAPGARWTLPAAVGNGTRRQLYFFKGQSLMVAGQAVDAASAIELRADAAVELVNGESGGRIPAAAGPADCRAGSPIRPVCHEHPSRDRAGDGRLPPHPVWRLALARQCACPWARSGAVCAAPGWARGAAHGWRA